MVPTHERLRALRPERAQVQERLVEDLELVVGEGLRSPLSRERCSRAPSFMAGA